MRHGLVRRLRLPFLPRLDPEVAPAVERADAPPPAPEIEFVAYAEDCRLTGRLRLDAARLTDLLNDHDEFELIGVLVERLSDASSLEVRNLAVARDELLVVAASGPRGDPGRRQRVRPHPIAVQLGPYHVRGYIHVLPGADPIVVMRRRRPMVPLTEAWIEWTQGGATVRRHENVLIVNRSLADWVQSVTDADVDLPSVPELPRPVETGRLVKDFTGELLTG
ncbi:MAG TPA: hypothetical protein VNJ28_00705 [Candidatus Limnocylindrales bacterium]|nr:hypothetical protein [Candidatus Limnocylindrales bacterium]